MSWDHRVIYHSSKRKQFAKKHFDTEECLAIHEVYYDDEGNPMFLTENPVGIIGDEGISSIVWTLKEMLKATKKPILDYKTLKEISKEKQNEFSKSIQTKK